MSSYQLKQEQERLERDSIQKGIDRYLEALGREEERGREFDTPVAERMLRSVVRTLVPEMQALQAEGLTHNDNVLNKGGQALAWGYPVNLVSAEALAYITVKTLVTSIGSVSRVQHFAGRIGRLVQCEYWWAEARKKESARIKGTGERNRLEELKSRVKEVNPKAVKKWMKQLDDLSIDKWELRLCMALGSALLAKALPHLQDIVEETLVRVVQGNSARMEKRLSLRDDFVERLHEAHLGVAMMRPWVMPMVCPPTPWEFHGDGLVGGYRLLDQRYNVAFLRGYREDHTSLEDVPDEVLEALNKLQGTPWVINRHVLGAAKDCFESDLGPLPYEAPRDFPELIKPEDWEGMSRTEKGKAKAERARVHDHNNVQAEKKLALTRALTVAERFKDYEAIYFPHSIDWRGRAYPIPQDLHPQGSDMVKALLMFKAAKPLGDRGWDWLQQHVAACYGLDKHDRDTQLLWVAEQWDRLMHFGANPWAYMEFWLGAEEPWQFLAACQELVFAAYYEAGPENYPSRLPISVDGSCNGLQHLSAMGLDPVGAKAVNLLPGPRQDVYQIVADKVREAVRIDCTRGGVYPLETARSCMVWLDKVTRKTVKRGVMTTPYGVTPRGIATQLKKDGFTRGMPDELEAANYLRAHMVEAIDSTIVKGKEVMGWMQACAELLAQENQGISWCTPLGLKVTQRYTNPKVTQLRTLMGKLVIHTKATEDITINTTKQKHAVAPNIIHSFDAAHMMMVVLSMPEDTSFAMVHDSFGCHASDVDEILEVAKETFVEIYRHDWFEILKGDFTFYSDRQSMPPAPERGDLDINEVLKSDYFFA